MLRLLVLAAAATLVPRPARAAPPLAIDAHGNAVVGSAAIGVRALFAAAGATHAVDIRWRCLRPGPQGGCVELGGDATGDGMSLALSLVTDDSAAAALLSADGRWLSDGATTLLGLELDLPGDKPELFGRDRKPARAAHAFLGRFDPKWLTLGALTVVVDDDLDGLEVTAARGRTRLRLELDAVAARPFVHDTRCTRRWRDPNRRVTEPRRFHSAGERARAAAQIFAGPRPRPLLVSPWPDGRRAAFVISDHADQSSPPTFAALARAFLTRDLPLTKALFATGGAKRPQLEDAGVRALADELHAAGSEIIPHSATPNPDDPREMERALALFERWDARTYIDHQPETNCEAFGNQGFHSSGKWALAPLLAAHNYDYIWAEGDDRPPRLNLLDPARLGARVHTLYPLGRLDAQSPMDLWMWRSTWSFLPQKQFLAMYAPRALDALEAERGLHIAHTYLETLHRPNSVFGRRNLLLMRDGAPVIAPGFAKLLDELAARQRRGTLWVTTIADLADRLRAIARLRLRWMADGTVAVTTAVDLPAVTLISDGAPPQTRDFPTGTHAVHIAPP